MLLCLSSLDVMAAEIKAFNMTNVESELFFRYLYDEQTFYTSGIKTQQDIRPTFQEEYRINTDSYVFHPNLLSMNLGASFLLDQSRVESLFEENRNNEQLLGYNAKLDFLNKKPYPMSIYYTKANPSVSVGLAGRFIQENIKYGVDMALLQPVTPVQITVNAYRQLVNGEGLDQITDDDLEHVNLRLYRPYNKGDHMQLSYQIDNRDSRSGNPNLPIQPRTTSTTSTYFDSRNWLGGNRNGELIVNASYNTQEEFPKREELRVNPMINWQHGQSLRSFYRINYNNTSEDAIDTEQASIISGLGYSGENNTASFDVHAENNESTDLAFQTGLEYQNVGANYNITHSRPVGLGSLKVSYSGSLDYRDQTSPEGTLRMLSEAHILVDTTPVTLRNDFVITNDPINYPLEVWNEGRTQRFTENQDYRVLVVGSKTQIQRIAVDEGGIISGQTVLVDYFYETGGTFAYDLQSNNLHLSWFPLSFYELYARYLNSTQTLQEGIPLTPLNSLTSVTYGLRADRPLLNGINLGGEIYLEDRDEDINPFTRKNIDAYVELPLPRLTNLRLSARRLLVDNENSVEDVDLTGYIARIQTRPWLRARLSYELSYETDIGGSIDRSLTIQRLQLGWAYRQLSITGDAHYSVEEQGVSDRERWAIRFILTRTF